jgi:hypothetical protein
MERSESSKGNGRATRAGLVGGRAACRDAVPPTALSPLPKGRLGIKVEGRAGLGARPAGGMNERTLVPTGGRLAGFADGSALK